MLAFLKGNWTWALPAIVAAGAVAWGLVLDARLSRCQLAAIESVAEARRLQIEARAEDDTKNQALVIEHRKETAGLKKEVANVQIQFAKVAANPVCAGTPAARMFDQLVRGSGGTSPLPAR